jgi:hypothetical protein
MLNFSSASETHSPTTADGGDPGAGRRWIVATDASGRSLIVAPPAPAR